MAPDILQVVIGLLPFLFYLISNNNVPPTMDTRPIDDFTESFSLNTMYEKAIVTNMLNLSIGTTTLADPVCNAL